MKPRNEYFLGILIGALAAALLFALFAYFVQKVEWNVAALGGLAFAGWIFVMTLYASEDLRYDITKVGK